MELTIENIIKLILGAAILVAVVLGFYMFFKNDVLELFKNIPTGAPEIILGVLK